MDSEIQFETEIVWLEDVTHQAYIREAVMMVRNRRGKPNVFGADQEGRLVGYANMSKKAPCTQRFCYRRVFFLRPYDPYGVEPSQMPSEAVDPLSVEVGAVSRSPKSRKSRDDSAHVEPPRKTEASCKNVSTRPLAFDGSSKRAVDFSHPLSAVALDAFKDRELHDRVSLMPYLSGSFFEGRRRVTAHNAYKLVAEDILETLLHEGRLCRDERGWYKLVSAEPCFESRPESSKARI